MGEDGLQKFILQGEFNVDQQSRKIMLGERWQLFGKKSLLICCNCINFPKLLFEDTFFCNESPSMLNTIFY
jgi:hypothetical protein